MLKIKEADLHITTACDGRCPYCYVDHGKSNDVFRFVSRHGDVDTLKEIIRNIVLAALAEDLVFVGGDPCRHPDLVPLLRYAKSFGLHTCVLSNTHVYRENGSEVSTESFAKYLDEMDFTLHGVEDVHDAFNGNPGAYRNAVERIREFIAFRGSSDKSVGIIINFTPEIIRRNLHRTLVEIIEDLKLDPKRDFFMAQRIALVGRAASDPERWCLTRADIENALKVFAEITKTYGFEFRLDAVDAFPWCAVPEEFHYMLTPGGCQWGQPDGVLSILPDGKIQRCALSAKTIGDMLSMKTPEEFSQWYENNYDLKRFREKQHLPEKCRECKYFEKCGGGCVIASGKDQYAGKMAHRRDYLADAK